MRPLLHRSLTLMAALLLAAATWAGAPSRADQEQVRQLIRAQLAAFAADDAQRAFSFAAPGIRESFGTPENFLEMVRTQYPMVYRASRTTFLAAEQQGNELVQPVLVTDAAGANWHVTYLLLRQKDKRWRIGACVAAPSTTRMVAA